MRGRRDRATASARPAAPDASRRRSRPPPARCSAISAPSSASPSRSSAASARRAARAGAATRRSRASAGAPPLAGGEDADRQIERMAEADALGGAVEIRVARRSLPIERRPEAQRLAQRQRRLQRIGMAEIVRDRVVLAARPRSGACPAAGRSRPARTRSRLDLPEPFGPVTASSCAGADAERKAGEDEPRRRATQARSRASTASGAKAARRHRRSFGRVSLERLQNSGLGLRNPLYPRRPGAAGAPPRRRSSKIDTACASAPRFDGGPPSTRSAQGARPVSQPIARQLQMPPHARRRPARPTPISRCRRRRRTASPGISRLPFSLKVLLENLLRFEDGRTRHRRRHPRHRGLAEGALLDARDRLPPGARADAGFHRRAGGGRPRRHARRHDASRRRSAPASIRRCRSTSSSTIPSWSISSARPTPSSKNVEMEYERNGERYTFLRWGQEAFENFRVVPPGTGICHQVNLEYLAQTVWTRDEREDGAHRHLRLSRHAGRHRLAHHHGERPLRARLGRRRHRGGGGHARPADLHADPRGDRLPHDRQAARRARPRPTSCSPSRRCCARRAWSASSSSSSGRACRT